MVPKLFLFHGYCDLNSNEHRRGYKVSEMVYLGHMLALTLGFSDMLHWLFPGWLYSFAHSPIGNKDSHFSMSLTAFVLIS